MKHFIYTLMIAVLLVLGDRAQAQNDSLQSDYTTGCDTFVAPFEEHFGSSQHCWTLDLAYTVGLDYIYTSNYVSPTISVPYGYVDTTRAISPVIDVSALTNPYLKFSRIHSVYNGASKKLNVYYRDYEADGWHYLGSFITPTSSWDWKTDSMAIPSHSATLQIGFFSILQGNSPNSRISLDDIYVYDGPDCEVVSDVALAKQSGDTAYIHWVCNNPSGCLVRYKTPADTGWTYTNDLGGYAIIAPLSVYTQYEVEVASVCNTLQWGSCDFISQANTASLPYFTDFSDTADRSWTLDRGACINHWKIGAPGGYPQISNAMFVTNNDITAGYGLDNFYSIITASKRFNMSDISTVYIEFDVLCGGSKQNYTPKDYLKVFFAPSSVMFPASEQDLPFAELSNQPSSTDYAMSFQDYLSQTDAPYYHYKLNLTQGNVLHISAEMPNLTPNGESQLVFVWHNDYSTYSDEQPGAIITNVHVWQPECDAVEQLNVDGVIGQSATVSWNPPAMAPNFIVECKLPAQEWTDTNVMVYNVDTNFVIINGLLPDTTYDVRVRVDCGNVLGMGNWRYTTFNTSCAIVVTDNNPYVEEFNTYPECWNLSANPNHSWQWTSSDGILYHSSHNSAPSGEECQTYSPMMDISAVSHPYLKFSHRQQGDFNFHQFDYLRVDYRTSLMDTWQTLEVYDTEAAVMRADSLPLPDSLQYIQLAFVAIRQNGTPIMIDEVSVYNGPTCVPLTSVTVDDVTANTAAISWTGYGADNYLVRYRDISDTSWIYGNTTDTTYIINNLQDSRTYIVEVSCDCYEPNWLAAQFSTLLTAVALPYFTDFAPTSDRGWLLNNGDCANYWTMGEVDTANNVNALFVTHDGNTPGYSLTDVSVVTAEKLFNVGTVDSIIIEFDVRIGGEARYDFIKLFLVPEFNQYPATSDADYNHPYYAKKEYSYYAYDFKPYNHLTMDPSYSAAYFFTKTIGDGFVHIAAVMPNPVSNSNTNHRAKVVFLWNNDHMWGDQPGAVITNISVRNNACVPVSQLTADNVLSTTADISWTVNGGETDWILEYKEASLSAWTQVFVSGTPSYSLTGLTPSTSYNVRVKADCGSCQSISQDISFTTEYCDSNCLYSFVLYDNYGDGWNGNSAVHVTQQGDEIATLIATNHHLQHTHTYDTVEVKLCHNEDVTLDWTWGIWWQEAGVTVLDPDGNTVYTVTGMWNHDTTLTTFTVNCPYGSSVVITDSTDSVTLNGVELYGNIENIDDQQIINDSINWSTTETASTTTGLSDYERAFIVYPNPANNVVNVECRMDNVQWGGEIEIVDMYGKIVAVVGANNYSPLQTRINVSGLAAGIYFVRIPTDRGFVTKSFVKQ